mgnify:CR=1 FL=1
MTQHAIICHALRTFIASRPGLDVADYGDVRAYRAESRQITRDRGDALTLLNRIEPLEVTDAEWADAFRAYSGRLTWDGAKLSYCTGQYYPTEYRRAAAAVLAALLWRRYDDLGTPSGYAVCRYGDASDIARFDTREAAEAGVLVAGGPAEAYIRTLYGPDRLSPGEYKRRLFRRMFGRPISARWFR